MHIAAGCPFCEIVSRDRHAEIVYEDADFIAFLDAAPLTRGHCLLVPRQHIPTLLDVPPQLLSLAISRAQYLSRELMRVLEADGILLAANTIVQQTVPHFHLHLVPRWHNDQLHGFTSPTPGNRSLNDVAQQLRKSITAPQGNLDEIM